MAQPAATGFEEPAATGCVPTSLENQHGRTPYYQRGSVTLYHADCRELSIPCDLLVTDPPYGVNYKSRTDRFDVLTGDDDLAGVTAALLHVVKGLQPRRHCYIFGHKFDFTGFPLSGFTRLVWDKERVGIGNLASPWGPQHELITFAVKTPSKANRAAGDGNLAARLRKGSVLRDRRSCALRHPTEKPISILREMIESSSRFGETVYDPFAGSGSTLIAAALEGRLGVGCEINERFCEISAKRFEKEL